MQLHHIVAHLLLLHQIELQPLVWLQHRCIQRPLQHLLGYLGPLSMFWPIFREADHRFTSTILLFKIIWTPSSRRGLMSMTKKTPNPHNNVQAEAHLLSACASPLIFHSQNKIVHDMIRKEKNAMWPMKPRCYKTCRLPLLYIITSCICYGARPNK